MRMLAHLFAEASRSRLLSVKPRDTDGDPELEEALADPDAAALGLVALDDAPEPAWFKKCHLEVTPEFSRAWIMKGLLVWDATMIWITPQVS